MHRHVTADIIAMNGPSLRLSFSRFEPQKWHHIHIYPGKVEFTVKTIAVQHDDESYEETALPTNCELLACPPSKWPRRASATPPECFWGLRDHGLHRRPVGHDERLLQQTMLLIWIWGRVACRVITCMHAHAVRNPHCYTQWLATGTQQGTRSGKSSMPRPPVAAPTS